MDALDHAGKEISARGSPLGAILEHSSLKSIARRQSLQGENIGIWDNCSTWIDGSKLSSHAKSRAASITLRRSLIAGISKHRTRSRNMAGDVDCNVMVC